MALRLAFGFRFAEDRRRHGDYGIGALGCMSSAVV